MVAQPARAGAGAPAPGAAAPERHVVFRAAGERFALPLQSVREVVVPQPPFARVPRASGAVRGAMNLRGRVVAVVELAPLLGLESEGLAPAQGHVLVLAREPRAMGLLVSAVLGVEPLAPGGEARREGGAPAVGVAQVGEAVVTLLDPEAVEARAAALFGPPCRCYSTWRPRACASVRGGSRSCRSGCSSWTTRSSCGT